MRNALAVTLFVAACGGGSDNSDKVVINDAPTTTKKDAPSTGGGDSPTTVTCGFPSTLSPSPVSGSIGVYADANPPSMGVSYYDYINSDAVPDGFELDLYQGYGAYKTAITTGTIDFATSTDEQASDTCGACLQLQADIDPDTFAPAQIYMPKAGKLNVTSLNTTFTATLSGASFRLVDIDQDSGATTDDPANCTTSVASYTFTGTIMVQQSDDAGSTFTGKTHGRSQPTRIKFSRVH